MIAKWEKVVMRIDSDNIIEGTLSLAEQSWDHMFLWTPIPGKSADKFELNPCESNVVIFLHQIEYIRFTYSSLNCSKMKITFKDKSKYVPLRFLQNGNLSLKVLANYLVEYQLANEETPNIFMIDSKITGNIQEPTGYIHSTRFMRILGHNTTLRRFGFSQSNEKQTPLTEEQYNSYFTTDGSMDDYDSFVNRCFLNGISPTIRCLAYDYLFGVYLPSMTTQERELLDQKRKSKFQNFLNLHQSLTETQIFNVQNTLHVLKTDLGRDKTLKDNPVLARITYDILVAYAAFNPDVGYVQGMSDLFIRLATLYVSAVSESGHQITLHLGTMPIDDAESALFWRFSYFLEQGGHSRMFMIPEEYQKFHAERVFMIIKCVEPSLAEWLDRLRLSNLFFLYRQQILLFERDLPPDDLFVVWDAYFSSPEPVFARFFEAAMLIVLIGPIVKEGNTHDLSIIDKIKSLASEVDSAAVLRIAKNLLQFAKTKGDEMACTFEELPKPDKFIDYIPKYIKIVD